MSILSFSEIADVFIERVHTIVWCNVATVDAQGRPRSRILHPIWEIVDGLPLGWIATDRYTLKTKHLARQPYVSLAYVACLSCDVRQAKPPRPTQALSRPKLRAPTK